MVARSEINLATPDIRIRKELAEAFKSYCQALWKLYKEDSDYLVGVELDEIRKTGSDIMLRGMTINQHAASFFNALNLQLKPRTDLSKGELNMDMIHDSFPGPFLEAVTQQLKGKTEHLRTYYYAEPEIFVLKATNPGLRYITSEWASWFSERNKTLILKDIAAAGGIRIHEMLLKEGTSPVRVGDQLKVVVGRSHNNVETWDGHSDIPIRMYKISESEF